MIDILVENNLIIEVKSVSDILPVHESQILTHMKLAKVQTGYLLNFNKTLLKEGIRRFKK